MDMADDRLIGTETGASGVVAADLDEEPTCRHRTVPSSAHAPNSGSQWPEWMDGMRRAGGVSQNGTGGPALGRRLVHVEQGEDPAGDEPLRVGAAPLVDVPVVVGLDHHLVDHRVGPL